VKPEELRYAKTHEWVHVAQEKGDKIATVGISAFAVQQLTDLVYIELPQVGRKVKPGESIGEIESVKAVSDLYSPVAGEIVAVNSSLPNSLGTLGDDPYGAGWIAKIRLSGDEGLSNLLTHDAYQKQCAEEA
jgi:glycine cleavage system H protein